MSDSENAEGTSGFVESIDGDEDTPLESGMGQEGKRWSGDPLAQVCPETELMSNVTKCPDMDEYKCVEFTKALFRPQCSGDCQQLKALAPSANQLLYLNWGDLLVEVQARPLIPRE